MWRCLARWVLAASLGSKAANSKKSRNSLETAFSRSQGELLLQFNGIFLNDELCPSVSYIFMKVPLYIAFSLTLLSSLLPRSRSLLTSSDSSPLSPLKPYLRYLSGSPPPPLRLSPSASPPRWVRRCESTDRSVFDPAINPSVAGSVIIDPSPRDLAVIDLSLDQSSSIRLLASSSIRRHRSASPPPSLAVNRSSRHQSEISQLVCLVDLEFDYINPYDSSSRINNIVLPEYIVQGVLCVILLITRHWFMLLLALPHVINTYMKRKHLVDVTEIYNQLSWEKKQRFFKTAYLLILFILSLFWFL